MILAQLKASTREQHAQAEAALNLLDAGLTRQRYVAVLRGLHALYVPLCRQLEGWLGAEPALDWTGRRAVKVPALERDLAALGAGLPDPCTPPVLADEAHAWGALYVLEGATLGGQVLRRHLQVQLGLTEAGLDFFGSYGPDVGSRWAAFGAALRQRASGPDSADLTPGVLAGAAHTFALFGALAEPALPTALNRTPAGAHA